MNGYADLLDLSNNHYFRNNRYSLAICAFHQKCYSFGGVVLLLGEIFTVFMTDKLLEIGSNNSF